VKLQPLGPGHVVGSVELSAGTWTFAFDATAEDEGRITMQFDQEVG